MSGGARGRNAPGEGPGAPTLVVAPYVPGRRALHAGGQASARWLELLAERGPVELACLAAASQVEPGRAEWRALRRVDIVPYAVGPLARASRALGDLVRGRAPRTTRERLAHLVRGHIEEEPSRTLVVLHEETALWLGPLPPGGPRLLDFHDVLSGHFGRDPGANPVPELLPDRAVAEAAEVRLLAQYDRVAVRSNADRHRLLRLMPDAEVHLLRHPIEPPVPLADAPPREPDLLLMTGSFRRAANAASARRAALELLPRIVQRRPGTRLLLVGDGAPEALADLGDRPGVTLLGRQDELADFYWRAALFLNPTTAGGGVLTRHLEAMVHGLPVVTTPAGAEGLDLPLHGAVADTNDALVSACLTELAAPRSAAEGEVVRRAILDRHGPDAVADQWRRFLEGAPVTSRP